MAIYSTFSTDYRKSKGRIFDEKPDINRSCFMRDRDRIIHSSAFRRLKYKTQVFVYNEEDYYRTRLSHSLEVSQLARSIAKVFNVNDDLAEAISLSHDLGHTPFGHCGEDELNLKMKKYGGFDHNFQALKILMFLEKKYLNFDGLNLTFETLDGILKHNGPVLLKIPKYLKSFVNHFESDLSSYGSLESQIASICDDIAYDNNDIDDGLYANFFTLDDLEELDLVKIVLSNIKIKNSSNIKRLKYELVRNLIKLMIDDLINNTKNNLKRLKIKSPDDIENCGVRIVKFSNFMKKEEEKLKKFLRKKMYSHPKIKAMNIKSKKIISDLFDLFVNEPELIQKKIHLMNNKKEIYVSVCDYISGMTDQFAIKTHRKFFNLYNF